MELSVFNKDFERIGIVDTASVIWHSCYNTCGDFEILTSYTKEYEEILKDGNYVLREHENITSLGIIENTLDDEATDGQHNITAKGRFSELLLGRRIVWKQTQVNGTIENSINSLLYDNVINPELAERKIDRIYCKPIKNFEEKLEAQYTGDNILEIITSVCTDNEIGFRLSLDDDYKLAFELYKGVDRSTDQDVLPYVIFSSDFDNLLSDAYEINITDEKNVALVAGEGEGLDRKNVTIGTASNIERKELFVDARDISSKDNGVTPETYNDVLKQRGNEQLAEVKRKEIVEATVDLKNYKFRKDFDLGDIVTIYLGKKNKYINARIVEILESEDKNGYTIIPTFSTNIEIKDI